MIGYVVGVLLVIGFRLYKSWLRKYELPARALPGDESYTLLGDLTRFLRLEPRDSTGLIRLFYNMCEKHKEHGLMKFWIGPFLSVIIWGPAFIENVANNPLTTKKGKLFQYILGEKIKGAFSNEGNHEWKELRKPLNASLTKKILRENNHLVFVKRVNDFIMYLKENNKTSKRINVLEEISCLHGDIFSETHMGFKINDVRERKYNAMKTASRYLEEKIDSVIKIWPFILNLLIPWETEINETVLLQLTNERRRMMANTSEDNFEFYSDFLIRRGIKNNYGDKEIYPYLTEILVAGGESSSILTGTLLVFLAMHSDIQEQIYQEQQAIVGNDLDKDPTPEDIKRMDLLNRAIKETLRHTATVFIHKEATGDIKLGRYDIPKGAIIIVNNRRVHHDPEYWERPNEFYPDHFLPQNVSARPTYAYIPFGIGIRSCPGISYTMLEVATVTSRLVRHFKFSTANKYENITYRFVLLCQLQHEFYHLKVDERL